MKIVLDVDLKTLTVHEQQSQREIALYSREAFEIVSDQWVRLGWAMQYYFTFSWFGRPVLQLPEDLVRLQEVVYALRPDAIVETGVYSGGSLLFHASLCEALGKGQVIGIDQAIDEETRRGLEASPVCKRIRLIEGDSVAEETMIRVRELLHSAKTVLVILDSHHSAGHVGRELQMYAPLVTIGSYVVVTDGIMNRLTDVPGGDPGWLEDNPAAAAKAFLRANEDTFELRPPAWPHSRGELQNNVTYWPDGWLRRKK